MKKKKVNQLIPLMYCVKSHIAQWGRIASFSFPYIDEGHSTKLLENIYNMAS
jgi:hypothetical protein